MYDNKNCILWKKLRHSILLERHAAAVRQMSSGTNGDHTYMRIATVGNTIQTVSSPIYEYSWKHSEAINHTQQHADSTKLSVPGSD